MKPRVRLIVAVMVAAAAAGLLWLAWKPHTDDAAALSGYVEGESLYLAAPVAGPVSRVAVVRGQRVAAGAALFSLDARQLGAQSEQRMAEIAQADAQVRGAHADYDHARASAESAAALAADARRVAERYARMKRDDPGTIATQDVERAQAAAASTAAQARAADEQAKSAAAQVAAADARVAQGRAALTDVGVRADQLAPRAPGPARVEEVYFQAGEWAAANQPIVSLLPDDRIKVRFFVPEAAVALYRPGTAVQFSCDSCGARRSARIAYVSPRPEFTPPIIYSRNTRDRLVFLVEAVPADPARLTPGLPVDVVPPGRRAGAQAVSLAIDVRGLNKSFGPKHVVDDVSIQVETGRITGFLGPNGSGKTTTLRMLCGLLKPDSGEGTCLGLNLRRETAAIKRRTGYMTQKFSLYDDLTIEENLAFTARIYGLDRRRQRVAEALDRLGLASRRTQLAGELSGGWKQRLALASCTLHEPSLLLLDEPTAGVDPKARRDFWDEIHALAARGLTVLVSTHYMDEAERCHDIGYILYGRLIARGTAAEIIARSHLVTFRADGEGADRLGAELEAKPGVLTATPFGQALHVSGVDRAALEAAIAPYRREPLRWAEVEPTLEDVFIQLMAAAPEAA